MVFQTDYNMIEKWIMAEKDEEVADLIFSSSDFIGDSVVLSTFIENNQITDITWIEMNDNTDRKYI